MGLSGESVGGGKKQAFYLVEVCVLSGRESEAALLGLEGEEAGQQALGDLQVVPVEAAGCLCDVAELVGQLLLHDGVQFRLVTLQRIQLNKQEMPKKTSRFTTNSPINKMSRNLLLMEAVVTLFNPHNW